MHLDDSEYQLHKSQHPWFAKLYRRMVAVADTRGGAEHRKRLLAGLAGRVIEVGAGDGRNFAHYPSAVTQVVAVEPEDELRLIAERAAADAPVPVTVVTGHAGALPGGDGDYDGAVLSLVLCSVSLQEQALTELRRVLKADGELHVYEHVRSPGRRGRLEDLIAPLWSKVGGGCRPNRETTAALRAAGYQVDNLETFYFRPLPVFPALLHVLGTASPSPAVETDHGDE